jgi:hypothetical protein
MGLIKTENEIEMVIKNEVILISDERRGFIK